MKAIRHPSDKGFILVELLIVFTVIGLLLPTNLLKDFPLYTDFENRIISNQLEAMATRKTVVIDSMICPLRDCWFNPKGNINQSRTLIIEEGGLQYELVIWLGFGRFKISKRLSDD
ncbi:MAG: prepilin-type N-terminal cleavage/methylation domain-containing protein [Erysipelothrix sp.]|nr:prepilin-type N-terminal cleavage/methylation domain-containing protein [Erysipelothrix sp.]